MYEKSDPPFVWGHGGLRFLGAAPPRDAQSLVERQLAAALRSVVIAVWGNPGWFGAQLRPDVVPLAALPAGPELLSALAQLPGGDCTARHQETGIPVAGAPRLGTAGNPCLCMVVVAAAWQACLGYVSARSRSSVLDAVGGRPLVLPRDGTRPSLADPAREDLAVALRLTPDAAATRIRQSRQLAAHPQLQELVQQGQLPEPSTVRIADGLAQLDPLDAAHCAETLAERVRVRHECGKRAWTGAEAAARARAIAARTPSFARARKRAVADRRVSCWSNSDGTATVDAVLEDVTAHRIYLRLTAMARELGDDDPRGMDVRRADILADLVLGRCQPRAGAVEMNVIVDAATLLGLRNGTASVPGVGPIPAELARELAADGGWRAWVKNAAGAIIATGSRIYRPAAGVARLVRAREPYCRMAGCRRTAQGCDLDHAVPWPAGATAPNNLGPLCRRHHNLKTHAGWRLETTAGGDLVWTTPSGAIIEQEHDPDGNG